MLWSFYAIVLLTLAIACRVAALQVLKKVSTVAAVEKLEQAGLLAKDSYRIHTESIIFMGLPN